MKAAAEFATPERGLGHLLREASRVFSAAMQDQIAPAGITLSQWLHLRALWDNKGMTQSELSKYLGVEKASSTAVLNYLEARKLIRRIRNVEDKRVINLELTTSGRRLVQALIPRAIELNRTAQHGLSKRDYAAFIAALRKITDNIKRNTSFGDSEELNRVASASRVTLSSRHLP
jgi:DNA-binding MarR family transcriptional regulator